MNVVILQPSYIPWRGYFDQIRRADLFIFYDDVQYDKHGWRNRNQIKTAQGKQWLTIPVHSHGVTDGISIKDVRIDWSKPWAKNHLKALTFAYGKAPYFKKYLPLVDSFFSRHDEMLSDFTIATTEAITRTLGITHTRFLRSSEATGISGQKTDRLIQLLTSVGASHYISGPSARDYIEQEKFDKAGITLEYINYDYPSYEQLYFPFEPFVSILDLLFMTGERALDYIANIQEEKPDKNLENAIKKYKAYFTEKIETYGAVPKGVDYNGSEAQEVRFDQLIKVIDPSKAFSVIDYGCGYGAMFDFLQKKDWQFTYYGFDMIEKMAAAGKDAHKDFSNTHFFHSENDLVVADYLTAGSIFNNKFEANTDEWQDMVSATLKRMNGLCSKGFSFNMLTKYSDEDRMSQRPDLFFGDPLYFFDFCKRNFSRNVALLHDYALYDFTILVRKDV